MKWILSLIAGALLPFAFAPYEFYLLAIISPFLLLIAWEKASPWKACKLGFVYGLACFGCGVYWVYISIHDFGNSNVIVAGLITGLFIAVLALFPAFHGYCLNRYFPTHRTFAFSASWALIEWMRSWIFTGFPWLLLGQSQTHSPLSGFIPIVGVYGVSFLVALSASMFLVGARRAVPLLIFIWLLGFGLSYIHWTIPLSKPIPVTLIQANVPQSIKWSPEQALNSLALYENLTQKNWPEKGGLVLWPETAVTLLLQDAIPLLSTLDNTARQKHVAIMTGIPIQKENNYYNSAIVLGEGEGQYFKRHLVPFGEYTPLKNILGKLLDILKLPMSDFVEGPSLQPLMKIQNYYIAPYICYEIAYSDLLRIDLPQANVLAVMSNDTWFGHSSALGQQRQIAQFAAESTGRYVIVAANSGETVVINPEGKITAAAPVDKTTVLKSSVYPMTDSTPWIKIGNWPFIILFLLLLGIARFRL